MVRDSTPPFKSDSQADVTVFNFLSLSSFPSRMSTELEREIQLYEQFEREQRSQETQKLRELSRHSRLTAWAAMAKKHNIKTYRAVVVDGEEVLSADVVQAVYCSCTQEIQRCARLRATRPSIQS